MIPEDSGEYVIKASNALGSNTSSTYIQVKGNNVIFSFKCSENGKLFPVVIAGRASIILESQAPGGAEKIRELEDMLNYKPQSADDDVTHQAPNFLKQLEGPPGKVKEGQSIHLECQVTPVNDPSLRIEWFFNGKPLSTGKRKFDIGAVFGGLIGFLRRISVPLYP